MTASDDQMAPGPLRLVPPAVEPAPTRGWVENPGSGSALSATTPNGEGRTDAPPRTGDDEVDAVIGGFDSAGDDLDDVISAGELARERLAARLEAGAEDG